MTLSQLTINITTPHNIDQKTIKRLVEAIIAVGQADAQASIDDDEELDAELAAGLVITVL